MSALLGREPTNDDLASICDWIEDGTYYICPEGMRALARGIRRLLSEIEPRDGGGCLCGGSCPTPHICMGVAADTTEAG